MDAPAAGVGLEMFLDTLSASLPPPPPPRSSEISPRSSEISGGLPPPSSPLSLTRIAQDGGGSGGGGGWGLGEAAGAGHHAGFHDPAKGGEGGGAQGGDWCRAVSPPGVLPVRQTGEEGALVSPAESNSRNLQGTPTQRIDVASTMRREWGDQPLSRASPNSSVDATLHQVETPSQ